MYKYQCSKEECRTVWALKKGSLNGFVLTCPICGKGRGLFISEYKGNIERDILGRGEEMQIWVSNFIVKSAEEMQLKVDSFIKRHSLIVISQKVESIGNEFVCCIQYKFRE